MTGPVGADLLRDRVAIEAADAGGMLPAAGTAGAQIRVVAGQLDQLADLDRPRALVVVGATAALDGAVLSGLAGDGARTPVVAVPSLPAWVGPLDLVVVLADRPDDELAAIAAATAQHRGARTLVRAAADGPVASAAGRALLAPVTAVPEALAAPARWALLAGVAARCGLLAGVALAACADRMDQVTLGVNPAAEIFLNPALNLAEYLLDGVPLFVGADRVGDALAAHAAALFGEVAGVPAAVLGSRGAGRGTALTDRNAAAHDVFADPYDDPDLGLPVRPVLLSTADPALAGPDSARMSALRRAMPSAMHLDGSAAGAQLTAAPSAQPWLPVPGDAPPARYDTRYAGPDTRSAGPDTRCAGPDTRAGGADTLAAALAPAVQLAFAAVYLALALRVPPPADYPDGLGRTGGTRWAVRPLPAEQRRDKEDD